MKKIALLSTVFLLTTFAAYCNTYTVSSVADNGLGSLRAAIDSANANPGLDSIVLNLTAQDNIYLQSALDTITDNLVITGLPCSNPTINGSNVILNGSALYVSNISAALTIDYVNFANCDNNSFFATGGAVSAATLTLNYCYFNGNNAFDNSGADDASGGAVFATNLTANNCTFVANVAGNNFSEGGSDATGGAVYALGTANLSNCTFYQNQADYEGMAVYIANATSASIINCTFANNSPAIFSPLVEGTVFIALANGYTAANFHITSNIVWGNTAAGTAVSGIAFVNGAIRSTGCNILQNFNSNSGFNITVGDDEGINPLLGPLAYYGGCVPTLRLLCGSPAMNHATCSGSTTTDARGVPSFYARDAGAFELPDYVPHLPAQNVTQCGGSVTLLGGAPSGANLYHWSTGATTNSIVASTSGYYHVAVTDTFGCVSSDSVTIYIEPKPYINLGPDTTLCGPLALNAGDPGDSYRWSTGQTTQSISAANSGTYSVTVTDPNSACSASSSILINVLAVPAINIGPNINQCGGNDTLSAGVAGFDTYLWSNGGTRETTVVATSGTYSVTVTNQLSCSASASVQVYIEPAPIVNLGNDITQCGGLVILNAGNPGYTYRWSNNTNYIQTDTISTSNTYTVTVTNPNSQCSATGSINVNILPAPVVNLGPDINQCGGTAILNAGNPGYTYSWSNDSVQQTETVSTSGTYIVTVTGEDNCSATGTIQVYIKSVPVVNLGPDVTQCGGTVTLDAGNNNYQYLWSTSSDSNIIVVNSTNIYAVTVTDLSTFCTASDSVLVTIDTVPVVNLGPDTTQCGGTITLNAGNPGATYIWSDNSRNQTLVVSASGIYQVTVTNSNSCSATGAITVTINPIPVVTMSLQTPYNVCITTPAFALYGGSPLGGVYYEADTAISTFNPYWQNIGLHEITYVYTNTYGCKDSDSVGIVVRPQPSITTIPPPFLCTTSTEINLNNYFNPTGGVYTGIGVSGNFFYPNLAPPGIDSIRDIYTDNFGCMDTATYPVPVHRPVHVTITPSVADFTICLNQSITFTSGGAEFYQFFVNDSAVTAATTDSIFTTTTLANHSIVYVVGSNPCSTDTSEPMVIDVITPPVVSAGPDTSIALGQSVELHGVATGNGNLTYLWTPGNGLNFINVPNPTYSGSDSITFSFKATDSYGCADSVQVTVDVYIPDNVLLPNVITPNGDGFNDIWKLNPKINLDGSHLVIFDRWGHVVYEVDNYANNWGGTYKSTGTVLPDDTYYYVLKVPAQHNHVYEGAINLLSGNTK